MAEIKRTAASASAADFARNFGRYQDEAISSRFIVVTSHERVVGGSLSADELARYERLKAREAEVLVVGALPQDAITDIEAAECGKAP